MQSKCFCQSTVIEISGDPDWIAYCHCEDCRRATGAPVTAYASYKDDFLNYQAGELNYYESSPGTFWGSCAICHSPMTYQTKEYVNETHLHLITIDDHEKLNPDFHVHCSEGVSWLTIDDSLPKFRGSSDEE